MSYSWPDPTFLPFCLLFTVFDLNSIFPWKKTQANPSVERVTRVCFFLTQAEKDSQNYQLDNMLNIAPIVYWGEWKMRHQFIQYHSLDQLLLTTVDFFLSKSIFSRASVVLRSWANLGTVISDPRMVFKSWSSLLSLLSGFLVNTSEDVPVQRRSRICHSYVTFFSNFLLAKNCRLNSAATMHHVDRQTTSFSSLIFYGEYFNYCQTYRTSQVENFSFFLETLQWLVFRWQVRIDFIDPV